MDWMLLVTALLTMNGIVLGLSLLSLLSKKYLADYGQCRLNINGEKEIHVQGGNSLLSSLFSNKYFIPSACGGKGTCGYCKVTVSQGGGAPLATEEMVLTKPELQKNMRLACQVRVRNDLDIHIPEEYLAIKEYDAELVRVDVMTDLIKKLVFKLVEPRTITFKPGQYVQVNIEKDGEQVYRGYSMANAPSHNFSIELNIRRVENGIMSTHLHALKAGDRLTFSGPYGDFFLQEDSTKSVVCVAGGVGLAPMKSIIQHLMETRSRRRCFLFYGARNLPLLYDHQQFVDLAKENENFVYVPALSDADVGPDWTGQRGLITVVFTRVFPEGEPAEAYLCGPPIMIDSVMPLLQAKGIQEADIFYDKF